MTKLNKRELVWYSPEVDQLFVAFKSEGFVFKNEFGEFHMRWYIAPMRKLVMLECYLIGEL